MYSHFQATCCDDGEHCCPENYQCKDDMCRPPAMSMSLVMSSRNDVMNTPNIICPDGRSECPNGDTCCQLESGEFGCCPLPEVGGVMKKLEDISHYIFKCILWKEIFVFCVKFHWSLFLSDGATGSNGLVLSKQQAITWTNEAPSGFKGLRLVLEGFVVTMHEGVCETGSQISRPLGPKDLMHCSYRPD